MILYRKLTLTFRLSVHMVLTQHSIRFFTECPNIRLVEIITMEVEYSQVDGKINFIFSLSESDGSYSDKIKMGSNKISIDYKGNLSLHHIHFDHLALAAMLIANPFIGKELVLPFPISERFHESTKRITKYKIITQENHIDPYEPGEGSKPGLSFSGGADSTAALVLMPKDTVSVFLDRPLKRGASLYNKSAAYATIEHARNVGHDVRQIECDLEYLRDPVGFPTDLATSLPIILMASKENIDSVSYGTILESAYRVGHESSRDYINSGHYRVWGSLFEAAGIPLYMPVAGISEVGTSHIVMNSSFYDYTRSCIRGKFPKSCQNCWKCFRKTLVDKRLQGDPVDEADMAKWLKVKEVKYKLRPHPISHENVLSWSLQGENSGGETKQLLMNRMEGSIRNMDFLFSWYSPSIVLIPEKYRKETESKILNYLDKMDEKYHDDIISHTMTEWLNSESAQRALGIFSNLIKD